MCNMANLNKVQQAQHSCRGSRTTTLAYTIWRFDSASERYLHQDDESYSWTPTDHAESGNPTSASHDMDYVLFILHDFLC